MRRAYWAMRLAALLSAAEARAFDARHWNCASFALAAVEAVTGNKPSPRMRVGRYDLMHTVPERLGNDGGVLARIGFALVHGLPKIDLVDEQLIGRALVKGASVFGEQPLGAQDRQHPRVEEQSAIAIFSARIA